MNLYLLRHGIAANYDPAGFPDDSLRALTPRGEKQVSEIASALRELDLEIDTIWCSPFLRTRQTATAVAAKLAVGDQIYARDELAPGGEPGKLLAAIAALEPMPTNILLVGHEPCLSRLISVIASGGPNLRAQLKKGGLAKLGVVGPLGLQQCAHLQWLLPPRLLVKIGH